MLQVVGIRQTYDVLAEIWFFPFIWALCSPVPASLEPAMVDQEGWGDATDWIMHRRMVERADLRSVLKRLPPNNTPNATRPKRMGRNVR